MEMSIGRLYVILDLTRSSFETATIVPLALESHGRMFDSDYRYTTIIKKQVALEESNTCRRDKSHMLPTLLLYNSLFTVFGQFLTILSVVCKFAMTFP